MTMRTETIVSAPGKVLITGGYLVLERPYSGLVLAGSSRFYTHVTTTDPTNAKNNALAIRIESPQFHSVLNYTFTFDPSDLQQHQCKLISSNSSHNEYIEYSVLFSLSVVLAMLSSSSSSAGDSSSINNNITLGSGITIKLYADNDFYSQRENLEARGLPVNIENLSQLPKFMVPSSDPRNIKKTGLGSSAALVTSLVCALLAHYGVVDLQQQEQHKQPSSHQAVHGREIAHRVAQLAHCAAQSKIGSGFDVSSAIYGSQQYTRFSPALLEDILQMVFVEKRNPTPMELLQKLRIGGDGATTDWDHVHAAFKLPPCLDLFLGDVGRGSSTPNMVSKVLKWKKDKGAEAQALWSNLAAYNDAVAEKFHALYEYAQREPVAYREAIAKASSTPHSQWASGVDGVVGPLLHSIRHTFVTGVRASLRAMGEGAGVPIEPEEQTRLIDATMDMPGVLIAGVPGAGGYDAIFAILLLSEGISPMEARKRIEALWNEQIMQQHSSNSSVEDIYVSPLLLTEGGEGARLE